MKHTSYYQGRRLDLLAPRRALPARPLGWTKPAYGTQAYWQAIANGWISELEIEGDQAAQEHRSARARASMHRKAPEPARWQRQAPKASRQYANAMATTAARDDRLTPQAKALLQVILARCGKGTTTTTCKTTLASIMSRHVRSVQRYIAELIKFGYITAETRRGPSGLYTGLVISITQAVRPFFAAWDDLGSWLASKGATWPESRGFPVETKLSHKNQVLNTPLLERQADQPVGWESFA